MSVLEHPGAAGPAPEPGVADGEHWQVEPVLAPATPRDPAAVRDKLVQPKPRDPVIGWIATLVITAIAAVLRFVGLSEPKAMVFDETYYVKDALSLLKYGVEHQAVDGADKLLLAGRTDIFKAEGSYVVHPPTGKWTLALGQWLFGSDTFGWRVVPAVLGTLLVLMLIRITRRVTGSTVIGCAAGLLLAVDGQAIVHSRTALLDGVLTFYVFAAFCCLVMDRYRARARLASRYAAGWPDSARRWGPQIGVRWWLVATGVFSGLALSTKWSGLWFIIFFGVLTLLWDVSARRTLGLRHPWLAVLRLDAVPAFVSIAVISLVVYMITWTGWFITDSGWDRQWGRSNPASGIFTLVPDALRSFWHYEYGVWTFNVGLNSGHAYMSNPWSWPVLGRPVSMFYEAPSGCGAAACSRAVTALGNPLVWWGGTLAVIWCLGAWALRRDWRAGAAAGAFLAGWAPWLHFADRTIFSFYAVIFAPYLALALALAIGSMLGKSDASPSRRAIGAAVAGSVVVIAVGMGWFFLPVWTAQNISYTAWQARMWLSSWV